MSDNSVLVVDPVSSGVLYAPLLAERGLSAILLDTEQSLASGSRVAPTPGALNFEVDFGADYARLLHWCLTHSVRYVIAGSEAGVELCDRLRRDVPHCPDNDPELPMRRWDKQYMFEALARAGVPTLWTTSVPAHQTTVPAAAVDSLRAGRPLVVKPARGASSVNVRMVRAVDQLAEAVAAITEQRGHFGTYSAALIQQMYPEPRVEYAVDTFSTVAGHELLCVSVYDKWVSAAGDFVYERGRWLDSADPAVEQVAEYARRVLDALGVRIGPAHLEIMSGSLGPRLIDFGARAHGIGHPAYTHMLTGNSQIHRECDYVAELLGVRSGVGDQGATDGLGSYTLSQHGAVVLFSIDAQSTYVGGADVALADLPGVEEVRVTARPGTTYPATKSMLDSVALGRAFVVADGAAQLDFRCTEVRNRLRDFFTPVASTTRPSVGASVGHCLGPRDRTAAHVEVIASVHG